MTIPIPRDPDAPGPDPYNLHVTVEALLTEHPQDPEEEVALLERAHEILRNAL